MFVATTLALSLALSPVTTPGGVVSPALALAPAPAAGPGKAAAAPGAAQCKKLDFRAAVQIDASALGDDAQGVSTRLRGKAEQELQRNDIMLAGADAKDLPVMVVKVVPLPGEDEGFSYTIDINHADHNPIKDGSSVGECPLCTESELLEKVVGSTRALLPKLRAYVTDFNNKPCGGPQQQCSSNADCAGNPAGPVCNAATRSCVQGESVGICRVDADCKSSPVGPLCREQGGAMRCVAAEARPPAGLNGKQKAGIGMMVLGAVGVGVGVGLVVRKPTAIEPYMAWETRETQKPGYAALAVGGAALITGVTLFLLGRRQQSKSAVGPMAGAGTYGLSWSHRF
jgi:hypothetical protein